MSAKEFYQNQIGMPANGRTELASFQLHTLKRCSRAYRRPLDAALILVYWPQVVRSCLQGGGGEISAFGKWDARRANHGATSQGGKLTL